MNSNDPGFQNRPEQYGCVCLRKTQKSKLKQNIKEAKTDSIVLQGLHLLAKEMVGLTPEGCVKCQSEVLHLLLTLIRNFTLEHFSIHTKIN